MTTETETPESQQAQLQQQEADFSSGYSEARGETPATPTPVREESTPEVKDVANIEVAEEPAKVLAGLTEAQIKELFDKVPGLETRVNTELSKVYGKFGEVQRNLQNIQQGQSTRKFDAAGLKRMNQEFPEIAQMLAEDLTDIFGAPVTQEAKPEVIEAPVVNVEDRINAAVTQVRETTEKRLLTVLHNDWQTVAQEPGFKQWLGTLPETDQKKYIESDDAIVAADAFTKYKSWKQTSQKSTVKKKERLEQAITPSGSGAPPPSTLDDEAAFAAGFNSVRSGAY